MKKWIWISENDDSVNRRICFYSYFTVENGDQQISLCISAVTKYRCWINGGMVGNGPVRDGAGIRVFDEYDISSYMKNGVNLFAVEVWNYGLSTYQSIAEHPGLSFEILNENGVLLESDEKIFVTENGGFLSGAPKRNVNLGFSDYYDGRKIHFDWFRDPSLVSNWKNAVSLPRDLTEGWIIKNRPIRKLSRQNERAKCIEAIQDVEKGCQVLSINLRDTLYKDRKDADETTAAVIIGTVLYAPTNMEGEISFPNRTWNGIIGDFALRGEVYEVSDNNRNNIKVSLKEGDNLFILKACGTFDDLYCHIELCFDNRVGFGVMGQNSFFAIGPLLPEEAINNPIWLKAFDFRSFNDLRNTVNTDIKVIPEKDIYEDAYILSLERNERIVSDYAINGENQGLLWDNDEITVVDKPDISDYRRVLLDFGTVRVGQISMILKAESGTIVDLYGFENYYGGEIDHTLGLNNGIRYICRDGWQEFHGMARVGFRYLLITIRNTGEPVYFKDVYVTNETYSVTNTGKFECSDELLNRIFIMCKETNLLCTEDSFTDCPTYEQAFWIGDAYISTIVNSWLYGDTEYQLHNAGLAETALINNELMNALTPTDWNTSIPMWMVNWVLSVFYIAEESGNRDYVERFHDSVVKVLRAYSEFITEDKGLYIHSWNLIDWAPLDIYDTGSVTAQEALLGQCYDLMGRYDLETGRETEGNELLGFKETLFRHINSVMWDPEENVYYDGWTEEKGLSETHSVQTHLLIYLSDMYTKEKEQYIEHYLTDTPHDFVKVGSPFILFYLYEAYIKLGKKTEVFSDIKKRWSEMIMYDSTTCWEVFPGFYENSRTRSYCHSWSSSPAYFMMKYLTGVKMLEKGFKKITVCDIPDQLDWCRAAIPTPYGRIKIEWHRKGKEICVTLDLPEDIEYISNDNKGVCVKLRSLKQMPMCYNSGHEYI